MSNGVPPEMTEDFFPPPYGYELVGRAIFRRKRGKKKWKKYIVEGEHFGKKRAREDPGKRRREYFLDYDGWEVRSIFYYSS